MTYRLLAAFSGIICGLLAGAAVLLIIWTVCSLIKADRDRWYRSSADELPAIILRS